jgi:hypothetical protein
MNEPWNYLAAAASEFPNDNPALHDGATWVCLRVSGPARAVVRPKFLARPVEIPRIEVAREVTAGRAVLPEERLPDSVLGELLETLNLDLAPSSTEVEPEVLLQETLDLEPLDEPLRAIAEAISEDDFVFDDGESQPVAELETVTRAEPDAVTSAQAVVAAPVAAAPTLVSDPYSTFVAAVVQVALDAGATRVAASVPNLLGSETLDKSVFSDDVWRSLVATRVVEERANEFVSTSDFSAISNAWRGVLRGESGDLGACGTSTLDVWGADLLKALGVGANGKLDVRRELRRKGVAAFGMLLAA